MQALWAAFIFASFAFALLPNRIIGVEINPVFLPRQLCLDCNPHALGTDASRFREVPETVHQRLVILLA
jgi:hypothetical protein